jgi:hypothetical protein
MDTHPYAPAHCADGILSISLSDFTVSNATGIANASDTKIFENLIRLLTLALVDENVLVIVLRNEDAPFGKAVGATASSALEIILKLAQLLRQMPQPVVAMVVGQVPNGMKAIWDVCDIVFADGDWATQSFPDSELEEQTYKLARELANKDALALRFTKKTVQQVASIAWDDILNFTTAQQAEIRSLQAGSPSARALAIESFLAGKSKPGAGA